MLTARDLTKTFGARTAVEHVSFDLRPGEIFALVGPNGAGKTTTLRMLAGLIAPSSGTVVLGDGAAAAASSQLRARIGFLTEAPGLWDRLTVRQNLRVYARLQGLPQPDRAVDASLELFGISDRANEATALLSKGLRQRVALARTLFHEPSVVLLDEPTSGLDPESARDVRHLILRLRHERRAIMICTHNLDEVDRLATRVGLLRTRLVALDTPDALRARVFAPRVRITLSEAAERFVPDLRQAGVPDVRAEGNGLSIGLDGASAAGTPQIVRQLVEAGASIEGVEREEPSLEQVYLRLLGTKEAGA